MQTQRPSPSLERCVTENKGQEKMVHRDLSLVPETLRSSALAALTSEARSPLREGIWCLDAAHVFCSHLVLLPPGYRPINYSLFPSVFIFSIFTGSLFWAYKYSQVFTSKSPSHEPWYHLEVPALRASSSRGPL